MKRRSFLNGVALSFIVSQFPLAFTKAVKRQKSIERMRISGEGQITTTYDDGSQIFENYGRVGIGTSPPAYRVEIRPPLIFRTR